MAGPAYYSGVMNIAKNEDWVVPFQYGTLNEPQTIFTPINLAGSILKMSLRIHEADHEAVVAVDSTNNGIVMTAPSIGEFTIMIDRSRTIRLAVGDYFADLVRLDVEAGLQERIWEGIATVVEGTTR